MGPINTNYQAEPAGTLSTEIHHFTHHHPLQLSHNHNPQTPCSACTHPSSTTAYGCQHCNYYLHLTCAKMPQQLQHPFDTNNSHVLRLLPKPVYAEGKFSCDACGHQGSGFSYHCADCKIDLHVLCAALPAMASVPGHEHQLTRVFAPPYENKQFVCDVCRMQGFKTWLYRCGSCQYDVHLGCVRGSQQMNKVATTVRSVSYPPPQAQSRYFSQQQLYGTSGYVKGQAVLGHPANNGTMQQGYYNHQNVGQGSKLGASQMANSIGNGLANGIASAVAQAGAAAVIGAVFGGDAAAAGGGGGDGGGGDGGGGGGDFAMEGV